MTSELHQMADEVWRHRHDTRTWLHAARQAIDANNWSDVSAYLARAVESCYAAQQACQAVEEFFTSQEHESNEPQ